MERVYIIYEIREENYKVINNLQTNCDIIKVFKNEDIAMAYLKNELEFQCSNDDDWKYVEINSDNQIEIDVYYCDEWQYCLYLKEMEVENA